MTMIPQLHPEFIIPDGVRYDGVMLGRLYQFTILADGPAHGATFFVPVDQATSVTIARAHVQKRREFVAPTMPLPPIYQRQPRIFCATDKNHY